MYNGTSSTPAGQDLTVHLGLNITGSDETKIAYGTPVMQKVGLSHREVKSSICRQILMVFFLQTDKNHRKLPHIIFT